MRPRLFGIRRVREIVYRSRACIPVQSSYVLGVELGPRVYLDIEFTTADDTRRKHGSERIAYQMSLS